ncbi:hypothetical protein QBC34DRAFT_429849 [Podospora aff. communis PSN243]|uniref:Uncharacterized protein n=1 Tax=Podospora aff. communis PSN243 TaxID=3040156 RepID=A0AAV9G7F0_9PEZI|nr:hypothetical protein QBC34DRAFT_429849 [Podospora aff. communis PSN243]
MAWSSKERAVPSGVGIAIACEFLQYQLVDFDFADSRFGSLLLSPRSGPIALTMANSSGVSSRELRQFQIVQNGYLCLRLPMHQRGDVFLEPYRPSVLPARLCLRWPSRRGLCASSRRRPKAIESELEAGIRRVTFRERRVTDGYV